MIDFLLNGQPRHFEATPDTSVLELLRESLGQTGTKEGCASGDCGACTVAIGETGPDGQVRYHSANACITPAHQLHGRQLVTVEGLAEGETLHPAQAAMVECHGSQCGFCTPGIVMSLFTLHEQQQRSPSPLSPQRLEAALGGNLCRCTGYRPIRDAALSMEEHPHTRPLWLDAAAPKPTEAKDAPFAQPETLAQLVEIRSRHPDARPVAGATDLWLEVTQRLSRFERLVDVTRVAELNTIEEATLDDGRSGWWVGAAVTYARLEPLLEEHYEPFAHLLHRLGSAQVRNRGTLGGNVANASPIGDTPPVLLALGSRLWLAGPQGERELPLEDFFIDYKKTALGEGEVIRAIFLPRPDPARHLKVWKLSKRREDDISAVLGAFTWRIEDAVMRDVRLAFGGMAGIPKRASHAEAALEGKPPEAAAFQAARLALAEDFQPMSDVRGSAHYREISAANLLERLRLVIAQQDTTDREVMLHAYAH
ncbi:xanthine dehydrogenase small subunit [Halomonas urumqiensis]|uniref:Xanthine dehydrogenase small subunit n=1 Tax=Halomonas urumqiensis TaxID=1684789 RepID=A0A2N7UPW5_9GAMM|nr:xanthine dehydrogenase small subunit [Halomonas urumqiensis]PMR82451.1 xanthine dehydrogenase small subunit [Halomonas urumqiensis]PTB04068.1 xanthine dehydrogenase small subunit [Halomonas urumqiensis]GHE19670.1 xanthine dehydrogenase [Halomonas urumqiensis]